MPGRSSPEGFVDDDCLRNLPGVSEAVEILMMVKGIAPSPIDESDIGVS